MGSRPHRVRASSTRIGMAAKQDKWNLKNKDSPWTSLISSKLRDLPAMDRKSNRDTTLSCTETMTHRALAAAPILLCPMIPSSIVVLTMYSLSITSQAGILLFRRLLTSLYRPLSTKKERLTTSVQSFLLELRILSAKDSQDNQVHQATILS